MDCEKTLEKYSFHKVVNDINNVVLEQSQPNEKATKEKLVLGFENNVSQQRAKMGNFEEKSTKVKVESLKKWTIGLSLLFLLIIAGLVAGLLILTSEIQDLNLQTTNMQNDLKSKDQMLTSEIQDLKLQKTIIQNDLKSKDQMLTLEIQDLKLQNTNIQNDLNSMLGEGGEIAKQIDFTLVKKGVIDCENSTQCDDDKACMDSMKERGKMLCEPVCERLRCPVRHSECVGQDHVASCECKKGFHGNGTINCVPDGFTREKNGKHYRMFDEEYVEFDNANKHCNGLGARLPVLDSQETIEIVKKYLDNFEQWDEYSDPKWDLNWSYRRVWLGMNFDKSSGLHWADGQSIISYPASSELFVWEAFNFLSEEATRADSSTHYEFSIDREIARLPEGGRSAILCEFLETNLNTGNGATLLMEEISDTKDQVGIEFPIKFL